MRRRVAGQTRPKVSDIHLMTMMENNGHGMVVGGGRKVDPSRLAGALCLSEGRRTSNAIMFGGKKTIMT